MYSFSYLEPVCFSMSTSNCCFLTCIQISQEAGQVVWYSHLLQNFPQLVVIHTVKGFGIVNKAEVDVFMELSCFSDDPAHVGKFDLWEMIVIRNRVMAIEKSKCIQNIFYAGLGKKNIKMGGNFLCLFLKKMRILTLEGWILGQKLSLHRNLI